ncbi:hypothetical protein QL285_028809 [Trifolium repens]|nr:hypothetical protein QL285_028809 [Trifolium repens]
MLLFNGLNLFSKTPLCTASLFQNCLCTACSPNRSLSPLYTLQFDISADSVAIGFSCMLQLLLITAFHLLIVKLHLANSPFLNCKGSCCVVVCRLCLVKDKLLYYVLSSFS